MPVLHALWSVFKGVWYALDGLRKVLHLILLLVLFGLLLAASQSEMPYVPDSAALVLSPEGQLVEEHLRRPARARTVARERPVPRRDPRARPGRRHRPCARRRPHPGCSCSNSRDSMPPACRCCRTSRSRSAGFAKAARRSYAYAESYSQRQYYLAAQADEVYLDPMGYVLHRGLRLLPHLLPRHARQAGGGHQRLQGGHSQVGAGRVVAHATCRRRIATTPGVDRRALGRLQGGRRRGPQSRPGLIQAYADEAATGIRATGGDLAQYALARGLVDGAQDAPRSSRRSSRKWSARTRTPALPPSTGRVTCPTCARRNRCATSATQTVGVVVASGEILDGEQAPGLVGGDSLPRLLRDARDDEDSRGRRAADRQPGRQHHGVRGDPARGRGAAGGWQARRRLDEHRRSLGRLLHRDGRRPDPAAPTTITGSIGVFAVIPTFQRTLDKVGITSDGFGTTRLAGQTDLDRGLGPDAKEILQASVEHHYRTFVEQCRDGSQAPSRGDRQPRAGPRVDRGGREGRGHRRRTRRDRRRDRRSGRACRARRRGIRRALAGAGAHLA